MINKVTLLGRLAKDPDVKTFQDGNSLVNIRLITSRTWKDKDGNLQEQVQGHNVVIKVSAIAKSIGEMVKKGHLLYVEGTLEYRKWQDAEGQTRYTTEVAVRPYNGTVRRLPLSSQPIKPNTNEETQPDDINAPIDFMETLDDAFTNDF